jgi:hypothetical protein
MSTTRDQIIAFAQDVGFNASVGKTDRSGNYRPYTNALSRDVPIEWLEQFARLVRNAALDEAARQCTDRMDVVGALLPPGLMADYFVRGVQSGSSRNAATIRKLKD